MALANERQLEAVRKSRFKSLIDTPASLGTVAAGNQSPNSVALPASGVIGISFSAPVAAGQLTAETSTGRSLGTPALAANTIHRMGYFEPGVTFKATSAIAGTVTLHYLDEWRRSNAIATGVFS